MTSEIRTNSITSRAGLSTVTLTDSGPMFSGITTFVDNSTFSVGTGGTIHAPATNVMALGTNSIDAIKIDSSGNVNVTGILTASSISGGVSLASGADNRVVTATGANAIQGEANVQIDSTGNLLVGGYSTSIEPDGYTSHLQVHGTSVDGGISILRYSNNVGGPTLLFGKSRGSSIGSFTTVQQNDSLGKIEFYGTDTDWESSASIRASADGEWYSSSDGTDSPGRLEFHTTPNGSDQLVERLRIASTGQVSISSDGTTDGLLTIKGASDQVGTPSIRLLDGSDTREVSISNTSGDFVASVHGNDNAIHGHIKMFESGILDINNGGASGSNINRFRIDTNGNARFGPGGTIGNYTNYTTLVIANTAGGDLEFRDSGNNNLIGDLIGAEGSGMYLSTRQDTPIVFRTGASLSEKVRITSNGQITTDGLTAPLGLGYHGTTSNTLTVYSADSTGGVIEIASNNSLSAYNAGSIAFMTNNNSVGSTPWSANSKFVALVRAQIVTSDNNSGDDCGADLVFYRKPEAGANTEGFRIKSDGDINIADGNLVVASGHGINFSATSDAGGGATTQSELFNDYERGTWTPSLNKSGATGSADSQVNNRFGFYVKCGDLLWISFYWYSSNLSFGTGGNAWYIDNLPYNLLTLANSAYQFIPGGYWYKNGNPSAYSAGYRWQSNSTNGPDTLYMYASNNTTNATGGAWEFSGCGTLRVSS